MRLETAIGTSHLPRGDRGSQTEAEQYSRAVAHVTPCGPLAAAGASSSSSSSCLPPVNGWCLLFVLIRQGLRGGSGPLRYGWLHLVNDHPRHDALVLTFCINSTRA